MTSTEFIEASDPEIDWSWLTKPRGKPGDIETFRIIASPPRLEFVEYAKTPRWNREVVITEKIDGTNGCIIIEPDHSERTDIPQGWIDRVTYDDGRRFLIGAQSRKRVIVPGDDNFGFAKWVGENAAELVDHLKAGRHYGEWWGQGIQRGYGLDHKRFSLFNTSRWSAVMDDERVYALPFADDFGLSVVPVLAALPSPEQDEIINVLDDLEAQGSVAAPGYGNPEGIILFHTAANRPFKVLLENDEIPKGNR